MVCRQNRSTYSSAVSLTLGLGLAIHIGSATAQALVPYPRIETGGHTAAITHLAVDQAERWLVTASDDKSARVWDLQTGRLERILRPPIGEGDEGKLFAVALSPDGTRVALGGFTGAVGSRNLPVYLFDRASGRLVGRSRGFSNVANQLSFSHDGARLAGVFGPGLGMRILDSTDLTRELARDDDCTVSGQGADFDRAGRLVTTCFDGFLRLYDLEGQRIAKRKVGGGDQPFGVRFSPDGARIAVGFFDTTAVAVVAGRDLAPLYSADTRMATNWNLQSVAWSRDGQRLYAAGGFSWGVGLSPIVVWPDQGRGAWVLFDAAANKVMDLAPLANGRMVFGSADGTWGVLGQDGHREPLVLPTVLDFRRTPSRFRVSHDGQRIEFGFDVWDGRRVSRSLARFDLATRSLETGVSAAAGLAAPNTDGLAVADWQRGSTAPMFNSRRLTTFWPNERSFSLAISTDSSSFVLGTTVSVRSFDASGRQRWRQSVPETAWAVNLTEDGRFLLAALGDGTIRWYDAASGHERLALFVHAHDMRWVLFTPEGFYQASPGGDALIGYQLNQGPDREGEFVDSAQLAGVFFRPDLITRRLAGDEAAITQALRSIGDVRAVLAGGLPPTVTLLSPAAAESDGEYELSVRITPARPGAGVGELKLFINGAEVQARAVSPSGGGVVTQRLSLAPGQNTVSVRAMRPDGKVASNEVAAVVNVKLPQTQPVLRVLAVGISEYDDATFKTGVKFAAHDAEEVVNQLRAGARGLYREVDVQVLNRREDTGLTRIDAELQSLVRRAKPEDVVVIFLAGHGKAVEGQYHFIPADFIYDSDQAFTRGETLSQARLETMLKDLGAGKRLLILDTCASGAAADGREGATEQKDAVARLMRSSGRYILAAASPQGKALEDGVQGHGIYTEALIEGLTGAADPRNTGMIEVDALADYVSRRVPELTEKVGGYRQQPMRSAQGENFPIVRRTTTK
jgi:WD40 repeat protein